MEYGGGESDPLDFETLFKLRLSDKLQNLFRQNEDLPTQFVLVPSLRDVFHDFVYPQVRRGSAGTACGVGVSSCSVSSGATCGAAAHCWRTLYSHEGAPDTPTDCYHFIPS